MLKTHIVYTNKPNKRAIAELQSLIPLDITWEKHKGKVESNFNIELSWNWFKSLFVKVDPKIKCFVTTERNLRKLGIKTHIGLYLLDNDGKHDFYIAMPSRLDARAKKNGFKTNFAWIFCHELLHGLLWHKHKTRERADDVHMWEKEGTIKQHLAEFIDDMQKIQDLEKQVSVLQKMWASLKAVTASKQPAMPSKLLPLVERKANEIIKSMGLLGMPVRIVEGFRSIERQNQLYSQGRTTAGNIVTNAKGGESFHNYGVAVDFVFRKEGYNATEAQWQTLGRIGEAQGFEWGGRWKGFVDKPHFELKLGNSLKDFQSGKVDYTKFQ